MPVLHDRDRCPGGEPRAMKTRVRDYLISETSFGWIVRHCTYGPEITETLDGRVARASWPSFDAACADIRATYEAPLSLAYPPEDCPPRRRRHAGQADKRL